MNKEMIEAVEEQIQTNNPQEAKKAYQRLLHLGYSSLEAKEKIGQAILIEVQTVIETCQPFNRVHYIYNLERLQEDKEPIR